ncbi:MAG TPA: GntR family transcriptional regulator [Candidatus Limnocylindria bacterium]
MTRLHAISGSKRPPADADGLPSSERTYQRLRNMILSGELPPGTRLVEATLAATCGVSRTPVREALKRLTDGNLVATDPLRGLVVRKPEPAEVEDVYLVREVLDGLAARLSAQRVTPDDLVRLRFVVESMDEAIREGRLDVIVSTNIAFHDLLYSIAANRTLRRIGTDLSDYVRRFSAEAFVSTGRVHGVLAEHRRILEQLERGDPDAAERASREHLQNARKNVSLQHVRVIVGTNGGTPPAPAPDRTVPDRTVPDRIVPDRTMPDRNGPRRVPARRRSRS